MRVLKCNPNAKVLGHSPNTYRQFMQTENIQSILEKHGLAEIDAGKWYPLQNWLDVLNDIQDHEEIMNDFVALGVVAATQMVVPSDLDKLSLPEVLMKWNDLYQMQHQGADVGQIITEKVSDMHYRTIHTVVYPDNLSYGMAYGIVRRWLPSDAQFIVEYDPDEPRMDLGGEHTIIHVQWEYPKEIER